MHTVCCRAYNFTRRGQKTLMAEYIVAASNGPKVEACCSAQAQCKEDNDDGVDWSQQLACGRPDL